MATAAPKPAPVVEVPDLSPVAAPQGLFLVGRLQRPTGLADTVAKWAGLPVGLRDVLPFASKELDEVIAWDAPLEFLAVAVGGRRAGVEGVLSLGLVGTGPALNLARHQGFEPKRIAPETYLLSPAPHLSCAIAPALGLAAARLVCAHRESELEELLPYATRGLPSVALGTKDLEVELKMEPIRQRFAAEIGSARLFAGFVVRELSIDSPRFDTAVSDAVYASADELVALTHDLDTARVEGALDAQQHEATLEVTFDFRDHKSWVSSLIADPTRHPGPAPESFFSLPADADEGGYAQGHDPHLLDGISRSVLEIADAYLEHEKVGKATRARVGRLIQTYFAFDGASVHAEGSALIAQGARDKAPPPADSGWMLLRSANPSTPALKTAAADFAAVLSDREWRAAVARKLKTDEKQIATARAVPLRGAGVPAGTMAVVLKIPADVGEMMAGAIGWKAKKDEADAPVELAFALAPSDKETIFAFAPNVKELAARIAQATASKRPALATRPELERMKRFNANTGGFTTVAHLLGSSSFGKRLGSVPSALSGLPHHGLAPIFLEWVNEPGATPKAVLRATVTAGVFEDLPGLAPLVASAVASH
ncbi:MAG TPA: hypothetical protein VGQ57_04605 [Polyangiaceae bacterium]|nr:hypothetical protein [Polyangiaceae bacterium]